MANGVDIDPPVCHEEEKLQTDLRLDAVNLLILSRLKVCIAGYILKLLTL